MNEQKKLTEEEVVETLEALNKAFDIMEFARGYEKGVYSPITQNTLMKELNINTRVPDKAEIEDSLRDPINHEKQLVSYGQSYYFSSLMYKRNIEYLASLPAFDLELTCINASPSDYKTAQYEKDYKSIAKFLDKFDYRAQFKDVLWHMLMEESYYGMFREFKTKSVLHNGHGNMRLLLEDLNMAYYMI